MKKKVTKKPRANELLVNPITLRDITCARDILRLHEQRTQMKSYLDMKMRVEDWHGVADAAMDLREIDAKLAVLNAQVAQAQRDVERAQVEHSE